MTFDIKRITASKEARRKRIAALSYVEKLRILDRMRERDLAFVKAKKAKKPL
ncbi:MAG: hypothetical protein UZ18_ATM001000190 [Armatimonadetes bacterium OLB18]|nr:MAG: hypothetical protein UZ18_ATM001000190 [Armatimonadetes bacterium OLB18]